MQWAGNIKKCREKKLENRILGTQRFFASSPPDNSVLRHPVSGRARLGNEDHAVHWEAFSCAALEGRFGLALLVEQLSSQGVPRCAYLAESQSDVAALSRANLGAEFAAVLACHRGINSTTRLTLTPASAVLFAGAL